MDFHCTTPGLQTTSASPSEADAVLEGKTEKTKNSQFFQTIIIVVTNGLETRNEGLPEPGIYLKQNEATEAKR